MEPPRHCEPLTSLGLDEWEKPATVIARAKKQPPKRPILGTFWIRLDAASAGVTGAVFLTKITDEVRKFAAEKPV